MAEAIGPRLPTPPGRLYGADRRQTQRQIRQLQQQRVNLGATPGVGGGIGSTRAEATTTLGAGIASATAWTFSPFSWGSAPGLVESTSGHFNVTRSGWYFVSAHVGIGWASAPAAATIYVNPATTPAIGDSHQRTQSAPVVAGSLAHDVSFGPVWLYGDGQDPSMDNVGLLGVDVEWAGGATPDFAEFWIDVARIS